MNRLLLPGTFNRVRTFLEKCYKVNSRYSKDDFFSSGTKLKNFPFLLVF